MVVVVVRGPWRWVRERSRWRGGVVAGPAAANPALTATRVVAHADPGKASRGRRRGRISMVWDSRLDRGVVDQALDRAVRWDAGRLFIAP